MNYEKYFDWAATSPCDEEILKEALQTSIQFFANPSAVHSEGAKARNAYENARKLCAKVLEVPENTVFFTSGGTESDHIPLLAQLNRSADSSGARGQIIISGIEHPALRQQCQRLENIGFDVVTVNPDKNGFIKIEDIISKITKETVFITVMAVNNETGCIQNIEELSKAIIDSTKGKRKPHFHVDCVQAAGKIPLSLNIEGLDSAALSAHKICGPRGIGILYLKKEIKPFLTGGGQEKNIRSGTENLFGAIAFSKVLEKYFIKKSDFELFKKDSNLLKEKNICSINHFTEQTKNTKEFISKLKTISGCKIIPTLREDLSEEVQKKFSPYVLQVSFERIPGNVMVRALDEKGFSISTGSACSAKKQSRPILQAMNLPRDLQDTAVRFSFGPLTQKENIDSLFNAIKEITDAFN